MNEFIIKNGYFSQGNSTVTGSLIVTQGITGSLLGTSSYALTASFALNGGGGGAIDTGSLVTTASFNQFTSSYNTGSFTGSFTGVFNGTSSWSNQSLTASYVVLAQSASYYGGSVVSSSYSATSSNSLSSSYALTASFALNGGGGASFPYTGSAIITGSLVVTGSIQTTGGLKRRVLTIVSSSNATPSINTDLYDYINISFQTAAITSMTTNLSGNPYDGQLIQFQFKDNGVAKAITWGASFEAKGQALPTTTTINKRTNTIFSWDGYTSKWGCLDAIVET